ARRGEAGQWVCGRAMVLYGDARSCRINPSLHIPISSEVRRMTMHWTLGCDANDPQRMATFWAQALDYVAETGFGDADSASIVDPDGREPAIGWLRVPEVKKAKNRVHIDIRVAGDGPWDMTERERLIRAKV